MFGFNKKEKLNKSIKTLEGVKDEIADIRNDVHNLADRIDQILDDSGANIPEKEARTKEIFAEFKKLIEERTKSPETQSAVNKMKGETQPVSEERMNEYMEEKKNERQRNAL